MSHGRRKRRVRNPDARSNNNYGKFLDHPNTFGALMSEVWKDAWFFFEAMVSHSVEVALTRR